MSPISSRSKSSSYVIVAGMAGVLGLGVVYSRLSPSSPMDRVASTAEDQSREALSAQEIANGAASTKKESSALKKTPSASKARGAQEKKGSNAGGNPKDYAPSKLDMGNIAQDGGLSSGAQQSLRELDGDFEYFHDLGLFPSTLDEELDPATQGRIIQDAWAEKSGALRDLEAQYLDVARMHEPQSGAEALLRAGALHEDMGYAADEAAVPGWMDDAQFESYSNNLGIKHERELRMAQQRYQQALDLGSSYEIGQDVVDALNSRLETVQAALDSL